MSDRKGAKGAIPKSTRPILPFVRSGKTSRTPPKQTQPSHCKNQKTNTTARTADESMYQCEVCLITDKGDKVCCDSCNLWSHFTCVNVTSDIANHDWVCQQCQVKNQEPLIAIHSDVTDTAGGTNVTKGQQVASNPSEINMEKQVVLGSVHAMFNTSQVAINQQSQLVVEQPVVAEVHSNSARSHKSKSVKSTTSTSSRRKALALQRLEEEQRLKRLRDQEERERRDEERRERAKEDAEYLQKKYAILEDDSDASMCYDDYDDGYALNTLQREDINRWINDKCGIPNQADEMMRDFTTGRDSNMVPQMSSTNVFHQRVRQDANHKNELTPVTDNNVGPTSHDNKSPIEQSVSNPTISSNNQLVNPSYIIDVQSTQQNSIILQRGQRTATSQLNLQSNVGNTQMIGQNTSSQLYKTDLNSQNKSGHAFFGQQSNDPTHIPTVTLNSQQMTVQRVSSNPQPLSTSDQMFGYNKNVSSNIGYSATQPTNPSYNSTFVVNSEPPQTTRTINPSIFTLGGLIPPLTASHQQPISSQMPVVLSHQPIMSSYHQPILGQIPCVSSQSSMANYQQNTSNPQSTIGSVPHSGYQNPHLTYTNHQTIYGNRQATSTSVPYQPGSNQFHALNSSSVPVSYNYQSNQSFNATAPTNSSNINPGGIKQLSAEQIAARQVIPKELPTFYGDPEDWQTFFSAYDNSTTICGYNNYENLGRIQRALKGDASDAVKSLLIHADAVPEVIRTLFMLYGRPELIIESMIQDIQKEPAPKDDDLSSRNQSKKP